MVGPLREVLLYYRWVICTEVTNFRVRARDDPVCTALLWWMWAVEQGVLPSPGLASTVISLYLQKRVKCEFVVKLTGQF